MIKEQLERIVKKDRITLILKETIETGEKRIVTQETIPIDGVPQHELENHILRHLLLLSAHDPLTGLYNRRYTRKKLAELVEKEKSRQAAIQKGINIPTVNAILMIDIDDFKIINDKYGHLVGDAVIMAFAQTLKDATHLLDLICRWGGEEFLILFEKINPADLKSICNRLRQTIQAQVIERVHQMGHHIQGPITASIGGSISGNWNIGINTESSIDDIIDKSDVCVYIAKDTGKNRVVLCSEITNNQ